MREVYNYRTSIYHILGVSLFALLFTATCIDESVNPDISETKDKAEYDFRLGGLITADSIGVIGEYEGINVDSNWDPDLGIVYLGTDKNILPTGTFTFYIKSIDTVNKVAFLSGATVSTADKLVGTAAEINAQTYVMLSEAEMREHLEAEDGRQWINEIEIGTNYISGLIDDHGLWIKNVRTGEFSVFVGSFTAIKK
jgi:hypothetical protein